MFAKADIKQVKVSGDTAEFLAVIAYKDFYEMTEEEQAELVGKISDFVTTSFVAMIEGREMKTNTMKIYFAKENNQWVIKKK